MEGVRNLQRQLQEASDAASAQRKTPVRDEQNTVSGQRDRTTWSQKALMMNDEEYQAARNSYLASQEAKDQLRGIDRYDQEIKRLEEMGANRPVDLSALVALVDSTTGSKLSSAYRRPQTEQELYEKLMAYRQDALKRRSEFEQRVNDAIKARKVGDEYEKIIEKIMIGNRLGTEDPNRPRGGGKPKDLTDELGKHEKRIRELEPLNAAFNDIDTALKGAGIGIDTWTKDQDVPGIGATGIAPRFALSDEGSAVRAAWTNLNNAIIYATTGKQINESEARRLSTALGKGATDREMIQGLRRYRTALADLAKQREAVYAATKPEVLRAWRDGGGMTSDQILNMGRGAQGANAAAPPPAGSSSGMSSEERRKEIAKIKRRLGK